MSDASVVDSMSQVPLTSTVVVPVGKALGWYHGVDGKEPARFTVGLGRQVEALDKSEHAAWIAAHRDLEAHARLEVTPERIDADPAVVNRLLERTLLVAYQPAEPAEVLERFRLIPTADGMGNTADRPDMFYLGHGGKPHLGVPGAIFALWAYSYVCGSMADGCRDFASLSTENDADPTATGTLLAAHLPALVAARCAYLEPVH